MKGPLQLRETWDYTLPEGDDRLSVRATAADDGFDGHAAIFWSVDSYQTAFAKGAFRKSLKERDGNRPVLFNHNPDYRIGKPVALKEDGDGLYHSTRTNGGFWANEVMASLRNGEDGGMSFGFRTIRDRSATDDDPIDLSTGPRGLKREDVRVISEVELWEISFVTFPAQQKAAISDVRAERLMSDLAFLLDELRAGRLDADGLVLVDQLVAARANAAPDPDDGAPPTFADRLRRDHDIAIALALAAHQGYLTECAA